MKHGVAAVVMAWALIAATACGGGDGGGEETLTVPTIDDAQQATQAAVETEETGTLPTATRVAPPEELPTRASGTLALATTDDLVSTGLINVLITKFAEESGYTVEFTQGDAGAALAAAANGTADVVFTDDEAAATASVAAGDTLGLAPVMSVELVIAGPAADPANAGAQETAHDVFQQIAAQGLTFVSRGDASGAQAVEARIWSSAGVEPAGQSWYSTTGLGAAFTLAAAGTAGAYTLTDMGTYLRAPGSLSVVFRGDLALVNRYVVLVVNPETHEGANSVAAEAFAAFLRRADVQQIIGEYGAAELGEAVFVPSAGE